MSAAEIIHLWPWRCELCGVGGMATENGPDPFTAHNRTRRHRLHAALPLFLQRIILKLRSR